MVHGGVYQVFNGGWHLTIGVFCGVTKVFDDLKDHLLSNMTESKRYGLLETWFLSPRGLFVIGPMTSYSSAGPLKNEIKRLTIMSMVQKAFGD